SARSPQPEQLPHTGASIKNDVILSKLLLLHNIALAGPVGGAGREMGLEGAARLLDRRRQAVGEAAFLEVAREKRDEFVPPGLAHFGVKRSAPHDGELLRFGREENQQAVFVR